MKEETRADVASNGAASFLMGIGCAPFLLVPVWIGLTVILTLIFGGAGVIIASVICALILVLMIFGGLFSMGGAALAKTVGIACPYCETHNKVLKNVRTFECKECRQRVLVKDGVGQRLT
jgi:DNA-directed RNA polymerase subunit RPC12/RpoP